MQMARAEKIPCSMTKMSINQCLVLGLDTKYFGT